MKREALQVLHIGSDTDLPPEWSVDHAPTVAEAIDRLANAHYDVAILSPANEFAIEDVLESLLALRRSVPIVICDPRATVADAVRYMQIGAYDVAGPEDEAVVKIQAAADACRSRSIEPTDEPWARDAGGKQPPPSGAPST